MKRMNKARLINKAGLLFYNEYEKFYRMTERSGVFGDFCREACGEDLSQDGFGDMRQVERILAAMPEGGVQVLDVGCGSGGLLRYIRSRRDMGVHGFDFSEAAIGQAKALAAPGDDFRVGVIGETDYPEAAFDMVISMDSLYFAPDMAAFIGQIRGWLRPGGVFFAGYTEGDIMPVTGAAEKSLPAAAFRKWGMEYRAEDITRETYELLVRKRRAALALRERFEAEGAEEWYEMIMGQTAAAAGGYEEFSRRMVRYIFTAVK